MIIIIFINFIIYKLVNSSIAVFIFDERPLSFMPKFVGLPNQINFIDHEKFT